VQGWIIFCTCGAALMWLVLLPVSLRERRPRRHGRAATAICREHLNAATGDGPIRVRCGYRPNPQGGQYRAVVRTHERIPQVGEEMRIVYDPKNPHRAENQDLLATWWYGYSDLLVPLIWLGLLIVTAGCGAVAT
jgi:hypothetical protein